MARTNFQQFAARHQLVQRRFDGNPLRSANPQIAKQRFQAGSPMRLFFYVTSNSADVMNT